jgi:hypothetical protein
MQNMKMLFFSSDIAEVAIVSQEFTHASIPCEVRNGIVAKGASAGPQQAELWIHDDKDCHRALMLCVQLGIGFSKRPPRPAEVLDDLEFVEHECD